MEVLLAEVLLPRVGVRVELNERERPVTLREHPQLRQRDRVVAAEGDGKDACGDDRFQALLYLRVRALGIAG